MLSVFTQIACYARQLYIFRPVSAAFGDGNNVIHVVALSKSLSAISASTTLRREQPKNITGGVNAWGIPPLGSNHGLGGSKKLKIRRAISLRISQTFSEMSFSASFGGFSRCARIGKSSDLGIGLEFGSVTRTKLPLRRLDFLRISQSIRFCVVQGFFSVGGVELAPLLPPLFAILGVPLRVIVPAASLLPSEERRCCGPFLRLASSKFCKRFIRVYNAVSHIERSIVRMARDAVAPGPGYGVSLCCTVSP